MRSFPAISALGVEVATLGRGLELLQGLEAPEVVGFASCRAGKCCLTGRFLRTACRVSTTPHQASTGLEVVAQVVQL